jgi:hypothetical protein
LSKNTKDSAIRLMVFCIRQHVEDVVSGHTRIASWYLHRVFRSSPEGDHLNKFDDSELKTLLKSCLENIHKRLLAPLLVEWIQEAEPDPQGVFKSYHGKLPKQKPQSTPGWWPSDIHYLTPGKLCKIGKFQMCFVDFDTAYNSSDLVKLGVRIGIQAAGLRRRTLATRIDLATSAILRRRCPAWSLSDHKLALKVANIIKDAAGLRKRVKHPRRVRGEAEGGGIGFSQATVQDDKTATAPQPHNEEDLQPRQSRSISIDRFIDGGEFDSRSCKLVDIITPDQNSPQPHLKDYPADRWNLNCPASQESSAICQSASMDPIEASLPEFANNYWDQQYIQPCLLDLGDQSVDEAHVVEDMQPPWGQA